jgi:hypothetical protein
MAKRVPDAREMLKMCREVRRSTTRYDMVLVCEELARRLLLELQPNPPDAVVTVEPAPTAPVAAARVVNTPKAVNKPTAVNAGKADSRSICGSTCGRSELRQGPRREAGKR